MPFRGAMLWLLVVPMTVPAGDAVALPRAETRDADGTPAIQSPGREERAAGVLRGIAAFPPNYDYPQTPQTVAGWVAERNGSRIRQHGWYLWAGLNQTSPGSDAPIWRTWPTSSQVFPSSGGTVGTRPHSLNARNATNAAHAGQEPINFADKPVYTVPPLVRSRYPTCYSEAQGELRDGPTLQNNGDVMIAGVVYDAAAAVRLILSGSFSAAILDQRIPRAGDDPPTHMTMPDESIVIKPMLWPVRGTGFTALPVWDAPSPDADGGRYAGFEIQSLWPRAVAVTADASLSTTDVTYLKRYVALPDGHTAPVTYKNASVVPVDAFYHFQYSAADLSAMGECDRALLDASAQWSYGTDFSPGDFLVLIAMHVMTHEQAGWTFQSLWWHDRPDEGRYSKDRPDIPQARGPWRHYLLTSTYGMAQEPGHDNNWPPCLRTASCADNHKWPVAYNPYIELAAAHPIATNCRNCHWRAGWPSAGHPIDGRPHSSYLAGPTASVPSPPDALDVFSIDDAFLDGLLTLDSMWAVADRAE